MTLPQVTWHLSGMAGIPSKYLAKTWHLQDTGLGHCKPPLGHFWSSKAVLALLFSSSFSFEVKSWTALYLFQSALPWFLSKYTCTNNLFSYLRKRLSLHFLLIYISPLRWPLQGFPVKAADCLPKVIRNEGWRWGVGPASHPRSFSATSSASVPNWCDLKGSVKTYMWRFH